VRRRDPRRLLDRRRREPARVRIVDVPQSGRAPDGSVTSRQTAEVRLPRHELERLWLPENLERLASTYWRFLERVSLGLLRVRYTESAREIVLLGPPFVLLRFHKPEYEAAPDRGAVTWRIDRGLLVAPPGRGKGYLRIAVSRPPDAADRDEVTVTVSCEVASFYPMIAGWGWFSDIGEAIYLATQMQIHVIVTHAFLRSLARLDLSPSLVGALRPPPAPEAPSSAPPRSPAASRGRGAP
jgi:hypothetical protein